MEQNEKITENVATPKSGFAASTGSAAELTLRACPFCGGAAEVVREGTRCQSGIVQCEDCGCRLESNEIGAGGCWNRRANERKPPNVRISDDAP